MTLRTRLSVLGLLFFALLATVGFSGVVLAHKVTSAADVHRKTGVAGQESLRLETAYRDMETGQRGFIISGAKVFLQPFTAGSVAVDQLQESLLATTSNLSSKSTLELRNVIAAGNSWRVRASEELDYRRTAGAVAAQQQTTDQTAKKQFDILRKRLGSLSSRLSLEDENARLARETRANDVERLLYSIPFLGLFFALLCGWLLSMWVAHPMRSMVHAVRLISAGDLSRSVPAMGASDVAELGSSIDAMRQTMSSRLREAELAKEAATSARQSLEQMAIATVQLSAELASELGKFPTGWTAAANLLPAEGWAAGDCYDVTLVSPDVMGVMALDIAGHGPSQAVIALKCKEILRAALRAAMAPGEALDLLAAQVGDLHPSFLTAFVALIDTTTGICRYANAGHPPAMLATARREVIELEPTGPILGVMNAQWNTKEIQIDKGGRLAIYTDGLTESRNASDLFYGTDRLAALVVTLPDQDAALVLADCLEDVKAFSPTVLHDDITMVLICRGADTSMSDDLNLTLAPSEAQGHDVRSEIRTWSETNGQPESTTDDVVLLASELLSNAAHASDGNSNIELRVSNSNGHLMVSVRNSGRGFDLESVPVPELNQLGGRGIAIARTLGQVSVEQMNGDTTVHVVLNR